MEGWNIGYKNENIDFRCDRIPSKLSFQYSIIPTFPPGRKPHEPEAKRGEVVSSFIE
jgi:hypothetical protein